MGNSGALHGYIAILLSAALFALVTSRKLGVLLDSSTAFTKYLSKINYTFR